MKQTAHAYLEEISTRAHNVANGYSDLLRKDAPGFPEKVASLRIASITWAMLKDAYEGRDTWLASQQQVEALLVRAHEAAKHGGLESEDPKALADRFIREFESALETELSFRADLT